MNCKNCSAPLEGDFCSNCGQKSRTDRINGTYVLQEIPNSVLQVDRGFLYTIKELFIRPGHSIREYLEGKRINHYKPVAFALVLCSLYAISVSLIKENTIMGMALSGASDGIISAVQKIDDDGKLKNLEKIRILILWTQRNYAYTSLLLLPFFSLATYISYLGKGFNYFEHLVLNLYIEGQKMLIYLLFVPFLYYITNDNLNGHIQLVQFI